MKTEWNVRKRAHSCADCSESFADGSPFFSQLINSGEELERIDRCRKCHSERADRTGSTWRSVYQSNPPPEEVVNRDTTDQLLQRLLQDNNPDDRSVIFILAVMLERKRILIERDVQKQTDGTLLRIYEDRRNGDALSIVDPQLSLDELTDVQQQVISLLDHPKETS